MDVLSERPDGVVAEVSVRPRAGRCRVAGVSGGRLRIEVTAAPEGGAATAQVLSTIAAATGLRTSAAEILKGAHSRHKTVFLRGATLASCRVALALDLDDSTGR